MCAIQRGKGPHIMPVMCGPIWPRHEVLFDHETGSIGSRRWAISTLPCGSERASPTGVSFEEDRVTFESRAGADSVTLVGRLEK